MDELPYNIVKGMLVQDYSEFINVEFYSIEQAIAVLLEESVIMMKDNIDN